MPSSAVICSRGEARASVIVLARHVPQEYFDSLHSGSWMSRSSVALGMRGVGDLFARCYRDYVCDSQRRLLS